MKFIKTMILAGFLLGTAGMCLKAQPAAEDRVIQGTKAKMILLERVLGANNAHLSANEQYVYGSIGENEGAYIYEIATGKMKILEGCGLAAVKDTNNYVATYYIMKNGNRIEFDLQTLPTDAEHNYGASCATKDLDIISYDTYIGNNYVSVLFNGEGKMIDTMPQYEPELGMGFGSFIFAMSEDGSIMAGRSSMAAAHTNFSPAIWDRNVDRTITTVSSVLEGQLSGTLYGISSDGTRAVGEIEDLPYWIDYNKSNQKYTMNQIPSFPGYSYGWGTVIQGDVILGQDQMGAVNVYDRLPWIYNIQTKEKISVRDHLMYRYGLPETENYPYFTMISMSKDRKIFVGYTYINTTWCPYLIVLEDEQIHPVVRNVSVYQPYKQTYVQLQWEAPLNGDYTVSGYNIYRNGTHLATINNPATLEYQDNTVDPGTHNYQIEAVYTDGKSSEKSAEKKIYVIGANGCLPVQEITATTVYNRTVNVSWGRPSANISQITAAPLQRAAEERIAVSKGAKPVAEPKYVADGKLDFVEVKDMGTQTAGASVRVNNRLYVGEFLNNVIAVYDAISGNLLKKVEVEDLFGMYDMTYHDGYLYCVNGSNKITRLEIDPRDALNITYSGSWPAKTNLTHIAYLEGLNDGKDMIMTGNFDAITFVETSFADSVQAVAGFTKTFDIKGMTLIGSDYYKGRLYIANQHDGNSSLVETFDWETGKHLFTTNLIEIPAVSELVAASQGYSALAAGLSIGELEDKTVVVDAMIQPLIAYNQLVTVEIESSPDVLGYNVYRDGVKVGNEIKARHFSEEIVKPGTYVYTVEYLSTNGCSVRSDDFAKDSVTIDSIGTCLPPTRVKVFESNEIACLSWELPTKYTDPNLVGFNVYRNGEQLCEHLLDLRLNDEAIEKDKKYIYRVEAFYDNSCVASDSVTITPTFEGFAEAPSALAVTNHQEDKTWVATATWESPNFEEPMALGYCGGVMGGAINLDETNTIYCLIGWTQEDHDLDPYKDLYLVGVEFMIGTQVNSLNGVVYIDDKLVYSEPINRVTDKVWHQHFFKKSFSMDQEMEVAVGYAASYNLEALTEGVVVYDLGPAVVNKGDIVSPDGVTAYSLKASGIDANLLINALVVRKRDLDQAAKMDNGMEYLKTKAFVAGALKTTNPTPAFNVPKTTSESYTLKGFNLYRDGEKRNTELLKTFSFEDKGLEAGGEYEYVVSAVYADGTEVKSEGVWLTSVANSEAEAVCPVSFLPNPVQDMLYIKGEYASLSIIDMTGRVVLADVRNVQNLPMANFQSGIYFVKVTTENGQVYITKIVKK